MTFRYNVKYFSLRQWERPTGTPYNAVASSVFFVCRMLFMTERFHRICTSSVRFLSLKRLGPERMPGKRGLHFAGWHFTVCVNHALSSGAAQETDEFLRSICRLYIMLNMVGKKPLNRFFSTFHRVLCSKVYKMPAGKDD